MARNWNRRVYILHRWLGLAVGLGLLFMSITGSVLVFGDEIDRAWNPHLFAVTPHAQRVTLDRMLASVREAFPAGRLRGFRTIPADKRTAYTVDLDLAGRHHFVHVDPYTGAVLGNREADRSFVRTLLHLHYSVRAGAGGEVAVFGFGLGLLGAVLTGAWVYRRSLVRVFRVGVRWHKGPRTVLGDLHKLVGVTALLFNAVIAVTGLTMLTTMIPVAFKGTNTSPPPHPVPVTVSLDGLVAEAQQFLPGYIPARLLLPQKPGDPVLLMGAVAGANSLLGRYGSRISFDATTGVVQNVRDARQARRGEQWQMMAGPLHFGNWGGLPVQALYAVLGLTPGLLGVSGALLWWLRRRIMQAHPSVPGPALAPSRSATRTRILEETR